VIQRQGLKVILTYRKTLICLITGPDGARIGIGTIVFWKDEFHMPVEMELQNKAIYEILMRILEKWDRTPATKQGGPDEGTLKSALAEEKLSGAQGIRGGEMDLKETIILSPHPSTMNSETPHQKLDEPHQTRMGNKTEGRLREVHETVILSPSSPRAGSKVFPSGKGEMERTRIIADSGDLTAKRGYPPKDSDIYETVILSPKDSNPEASPLKEKVKLLDTVLVRRPEESKEGKRGGDPFIQGTEKTGRSESKTFDKLQKPRKATGGEFLEQTIIVGSGNEKARE